MQALLGVLYHSIGGFASGSFYMPYNKVKGWAWESFWIVGGLFSWLIVPPIAAYLTIPGFGEILANASGTVLFFTFLMGLLWGFGGLTYGLGVRYLGMSLGNSVVLGFCAAFGAIVPSVYYNFVPTEGATTFTDMLQNTGGLMVLGGVVICLLGIAVCGKAGIMKEKELSEEARAASVKEFNLVKGLIIAIFSGIMSAFFNFGIEVGKPLAEAIAEPAQAILNNAAQSGIELDSAVKSKATREILFQNNVIFIVIMWGGLATNLVWTTILSIKNKAYKNFTDTTSPIAKNVLFCALAGTLWFLQFFFYGMGESKLGNGASSWILHMSTIILTANMWGIVRKEWKGVTNKTKWTIAVGILVILLSVVFTGIGNSLTPGGGGGH